MLGDGVAAEDVAGSYASFFFFPLLTLLTEINQKERRKKEKMLIPSFTHTQTGIHFITGKCFQKCVTGQIAAGYGKLDRTERPCMENCVQRFVDVGDVLLQNIGKIGPGGTSLNRGI